MWLTYTVSTATLCYHLGCSRVCEVLTFLTFRSIVCYIILISTSRSMFRTHCTVGSALASQVYLQYRVRFSLSSIFFSFLFIGTGFYSNRCHLFFSLVFFLIPDSLLHNCLSRPEESRTCLSACIVLHTLATYFPLKNVPLLPL